MANTIKVKVLGLLPIAIIFTLFLVLLKVTDFIDWSWIWVLSPLWIYIGFDLLLVFGAISLIILAIFVKEMRK